MNPAAPSSATPAAATATVTASRRKIRKLLVRRIPVLSAAAANSAASSDTHTFTQAHNMSERILPTIKRVVIFAHKRRRRLGTQLREQPDVSAVQSTTALLAATTAAAVVEPTRAAPPAPAEATSEPSEPSEPSHSTAGDVLSQQQQLGASADEHAEEGASTLYALPAIATTTTTPAAAVKAGRRCKKPRCHRRSRNRKSKKASTRVMLPPPSAARITLETQTQTLTFVRTLHETVATPSLEITLGPRTYTYVVDRVHDDVHEVQTSTLVRERLVTVTHTLTATRTSTSVGTSLRLVTVARTLTDEPATAIHATATLPRELPDH